uniref:K Homology domain-containing protein n=1 Tax=Glossina brevipalpis TaxID=37001 RepID=A0A1A9WJ60_9MUSC
MFTVCTSAVVNKDFEPELVCVNSSGEKRKLGVLNEGFVFNCSLNLARLISTKEMPFEVAVGVNGRIWINEKSIKQTVGTAILTTEFSSKEQTATTVVVQSATEKELTKQQRREEKKIQRLMHSIGRSENQSDERTVLGFENLELRWTTTAQCCEYFWQQLDLNLSRSMDFVPRGNVFIRFTHLQHTPFAYTINVKNNGDAQRFDAFSWLPRCLEITVYL